MEGHAIILIAAALALATGTAGAVTSVRYTWLAGAGIVVGLLLWLVMAVVIFRGPDNPDLGETGWTIVVGVVIAIWVGAWVVGAAAGRVLRRARRAERKNRRLSAPS